MDANDFHSTLFHTIEVTWVNQHQFFKNLCSAEEINSQRFLQLEKEIGQGTCVVSEIKKVLIY